MKEKSKGYCCGKEREGEVERQRQCHEGDELREHAVFECSKRHTPKQWRLPAKLTTGKDQHISLCKQDVSSILSFSPAQPVCLSL